MTIPSENPLIFLTGATGYVGGCLLRLLEEKKHSIRCLVRAPEFFRLKAPPGTEFVHGDVLKKINLDQALAGVHTAYYFIHSMGSSGDFAAEDRRAARNFGEAAKAAGVKRIIYLGGLGEDTHPLSTHLHSRHEVGDILRASGVPVVEFRTSIVIGAGSLSFELIRCLVERLPVMVTPRWVANRTQPIAVDDLLAYFLAALELPEGESRLFEIGGKEEVSYGDLMREYARQRNLKRVMVPVPVLTPRLSGLWLRLVAPQYARIGEKLIDSLKNDTVVQDIGALQAFSIRPMGVREAVSRALEREDLEFSRILWSDLLSLKKIGRRWGGAVFGNRIVFTRRREVPVSAREAFRPIQRIGGRTGWYFADWLWRLRGWMDRMVGGPGMAPGRHDPEILSVGELLDCWKVDYLEPDRELLLSAQLKLPGRAWLQFEVTEKGSGSMICETAVFDPAGLPGYLLWYAFYPFHKIIFIGMLRNIAREAVRNSRAARGTT